MGPFSQLVKTASEANRFSRAANDIRDGRRPE
jgi:hypothetical protein